MIGKIVTNNHAESSFVGVTYQVHTYGRIGLCNATDIINVSINGYVSCPNNKNDLKEGNKGMFDDFPEELRLNSLMEAMKDAPFTHQAKNQ